MLTARPLRAYAVLGLAVLGWLTWRLPIMRADIEHLRTVIASPRTPPHRTIQPKPERNLLIVADDGDEIESLALALKAPAYPRRTISGAEPRLQLDLATLAADERLTTSGEPTIALASRPAQMSAASMIEPSAAERGYALLAAGDRRGAAVAFRKAVAQEGDDPRAPQWRRQLRYLERRWSGMAYTLARNSGQTLPTATIPALTAAQSGAQIAYTLNPLDPQPFALQGRVVTANDGIALNTNSAQAALAVTWRPVTAIQIAAERLIRASRKSRNAWTVRVAAGGEAPRPTGRKAWNAWSAYAETGIVGTHRQDLYAASTVRGGRAFALSDKVALTLGGGIWASVQHYDRTAHWIEVGPSAQLRLESQPPVNVALDYRWRINGNADPGTGPALTVSTGF